MTTVFCPEVDDEQYERFTEALAQAAPTVDPFELAVAGGGAFPEMTAARHLICLLDDPRGALPELARECRRAARAAGLPVESRPYQPHLTLARANRPGDLSAWQPVLDALRSEPFEVDELVLVRSTLDATHRGRAIHDRVASFPLGRSSLTP